jgi:hypothetical protein
MWHDPFASARVQYGRQGLTAIFTIAGAAAAPALLSRFLHPPPYPVKLTAASTRPAAPATITVAHAATGTGKPARREWRRSQQARKLPAAPLEASSTMPVKKALLWHSTVESSSACTLANCRR